MNIASFDIIDTALLRKCGSSDNIFFLLSKRLFPDDARLQQGFYHWRLSAESRTNLLLNRNNLSLEEIYTNFEDNHFPNISKETVIQMELDIEKDNLIPNFEVKELIRHKREKGYEICFISDMYIPSSFLKKILCDSGIALYSDSVFVSFECSCRKSDGGLYDLVKSKYDYIS